MRRAIIGISSLLLVLGQLSLAHPAAYSAAPLLRPAEVFSAPAGYIVHGAHISPVVDYQTEINNFQTAVNKDVAILMYFRVWDRQDIQIISGYPVGPCDNGHLPRQALEGAPVKPGVAGGRALMLTWQPLPILANPGPSDYDNILSGQYNALIDNCADQLKAWSNEVFLMRFMHEFNISDSAYWAGHSYNQKPNGEGDTEKYKQVWRYVWQRFANRGVTNVQWVWSPNYASNPNVAWNDLHNYYPGDAYVDWIALSGFHWTTNNFLNYTMLYDAVIRDLQCRYAKPIMHAEFGSIPYSNGGLSPSTKEGWILDAYLKMQGYPLVRAAVWFNDFAYHSPAQADFRAWTSTGYNPAPPPVAPSITDAYETAVNDSSFRETFSGSQLLNPPMTRCAGDAVSANGVLSGRPSAKTVARTGLTSVSFDIAALGLGSNTTMSITGCPGGGTTCRFGSVGGPTSTSFSAPWDSEKLVVQAGPSSTLGTAYLTVSGGGSSVQVQLNVVNIIYPVYLPSVRR